MSLAQAVFPLLATSTTTEQLLFESERLEVGNKVCIEISTHSNSGVPVNVLPALIEYGEFQPENVQVYSSKT